MNLKLIGCIAMGVFVAHLALFMMAFSVRSRSAASATPGPPSFRVAEEVVVDPVTKAKTVNREITVSTRLRPEVYQGRPDSATRK